MSETSDVRHVHTHTPRATEIDIDVAVTTTGRTLTVKVGRAADIGQDDEAAAAAAIELSLFTTVGTIAAYAAQGMAFGKLDVGAK